MGQTCLDPERWCWSCPACAYSLAPHLVECPETFSRDPSRKSQMTEPRGTRAFSYHTSQALNGSKHGVWPVSIWKGKAWAF